MSIIGRNFKTGLITACAVLGMLISSTAPAKKAPLSANVGYVSMKDYESAEAKVNPMRLQALKETATTLGARGALAWRAYEINQSLKNQADYLDQVFDFNQLLVNQNVLPPVLVQSDDSVHLQDGNAIRLASKTYKIVQPAQFVTASPTWRSYLWMNYTKPDMPDQTLLPQDENEAQVWNKYIKIGWQNGLEQANSIFSSNLNRLKRDYTGIVLYRKLLAQGIVSAPYVAKADLGVTGDENEVRINDRVLRITEGSKLQPDAKKWHPVITNDE